ncbi:MAG: GntR family transcriptional regulator [Acidimicrobiales bacterium]
MAAHSPLAQVSLSDHPSLQERVYEEIRTAIVSGGYRPGERLNESSLAESFEISRNPIREALRRLQQDGLVEVRPRTGVFVASLTPSEAEDIYRIRAALEGAAAALAAERATSEDLLLMDKALQSMSSAVQRHKHAEVTRESEEFHSAIHAAAHSDRLSFMMKQIYAQVTWFRNLTLESPTRPPQAQREHLALLAAIKRRDSDLAGQLARRHVLSAYRALKAHQKKPPGTDDHAGQPESPA